jgi:hypothetical protein
MHLRPKASAFEPETDAGQARAEVRKVPEAEVGLSITEIRNIYPCLSEKSSQAERTSLRLNPTWPKPSGPLNFTTSRSGRFGLGLASVVQERRPTFNLTTFSLSQADFIDLTRLLASSKDKSIRDDSPKLQTSWQVVPSDLMYSPYVNEISSSLARGRLTASGEPGSDSLARP